MLIHSIIIHDQPIEDNTHPYSIRSDKYSIIGRRHQSSATMMGFLQSMKQMKVRFRAGVEFSFIDKKKKKNWMKDERISRHDQSGFRE